MESNKTVRLNWIAVLAVVAAISLVALAGLIAFVIRQFYINDQLNPRYWSFFARWTTWRFLLTGLMGTVRVALMAGILAIILGLLLMLGRISSNKVLSTACHVVTDLFRSLPSLLLIYFFFLVIPRYGLKMPLGLPGYFTLEEGLAVAKETGKPVFVDITGHGCVNCREMESRVWSDPRVYEILRDRYILVALYTDDKTPLDPSDWVTTEGGKVLKDLGRANAYLVRKRFGVNAQPNYVLLDADGKELAPVRGYDLDIEEFLIFLGKGLE